MEVNVFFTLFWIIYYPACVGFNDLSGFGYVDEFMTVILIGYTIMQYGKRTDNTCVKELFAFLGILAFYIVYSLWMAVNVSVSVWLDLVQQIRPYSVIYCTWILTPKFTKGQRKMMLASMLLTLGTWLVYHPSAMADAEFPVLGQLAITTAMSYYLFTKPTKKNRWIVVGILTVGLLGGKFKYIGEYVTFIGLLFFLKKKIKLTSFKGTWQIAILLVAIIFFTWERFNAYYVEGWDRKMARPESYKTALKLLVDYFPFGPGMGTFATNAAWRYYSPIYPMYELDKIWGLDHVGGFIADAFYPSLAEFGIVGVILFGIFWKRRIKEIYRINDGRMYRVALMSTACLAIESTADSSYLSGKGMGYFMLLGLCLASLKRQIPHSQIIVKTDENNDGGLCEAERGRSGIRNPNDGADAPMAGV